MFSAVEIKDGVLYFDAYSVTDKSAEVLDSFAIQKDKTQGDVAVGYTPPADDSAAAGSDTLGKILSFMMKVVTVLMNIVKWYIF